MKIAISRQGSALNCQRSVLSSLFNASILHTFFSICQLLNAITALIP